MQRCLHASCSAKGLANEQRGLGIYGSRTQRMCSTPNPCIRACLLVHLHHRDAQPSSIQHKLFPQALIDTPDSVRRTESFRRLALTDFKIEIPRTPKKSVLAKALQESGALYTHVCTHWHTVTTAAYRCVCQV